MFDQCVISIDLQDIIIKQLITNLLFRINGIFVSVFRFRYFLVEQALAAEMIVC
jgi:hypothetical protein